MKYPLFLLLLFSAGVLAKSPVVTYEPTKVELTGALDLQTFPGPPNYESIKEGDEAERYFYLKLDSPIDVIPQVEGHPTVVNPDPERNVKVMMLAISGEDDALWSRFRKVGRGGRVRIIGTLYHRWTGHHHSRVILNVDRMEPLIP